jgi:hypothetical protein
MSPEELAEKHPRLFHVTEPGAWPMIARHGLLSTSRLLDLFGIGGERRVELGTRRRPDAVPLEHPQYGRVVLNDQRPLSERALAGCLDDGLAPADWIAILNERVFFWAEEERLDRLLSARMNRARSRDILVVDTLSLARAYAERVELCPINSGATLRRPARRGLDTFTPLGSLSFAAWSRQRGQRDTVVEVVVRDGVPDIARHLIEVRRTPPE